MYKRISHVTCAAGTLTGTEMGKSKTTKFKRPQFNAVGLPVNAVKEVDAEEEDDGGDGCPAAELLEKVGTKSKLVFSLNVQRFKLLFAYSISQWMGVALNH